jgi:dihydroxyacetone kinase
LQRGDAVIVIVNGLGSTHLLELSTMFLEVAKVLDGQGVTVARSLVGPYVTSLDMSGCSVTLVRSDDEVVELWDAPVRTPALSW